MNLKGQGIHYQVDIVPESLLHLGSVLPYAEGAVKSFEIRNPMDQPIEVVSQDFDRKFIEEEEILKRLEHFSNATASEPMFLPLRLPGQEFWPSLKEQDDKRQRTEELRSQLAAIESELGDLAREEQALNEPATAEGDEAAADAAAEDKPAPRTYEEISDRRNELTTLKGDVEVKLSEEKESGLEVKYPAPVKDEDKLNLIILGPEGSGKSTMAAYLAQEHQRTVVKVNGLYDWCLKRGNDLTERARSYLAEREVALKDALEEQAKRKKPKKGDPPIPPVEESDYKKLSFDLQSDIIRERLAQEDCNAGAIFDCIKSELFGDDKEVIERICEAVPTQNVQLLLLKFQKELETEKDGEGEPLQVCTNYRMARRRLAVSGQGPTSDGEVPRTGNTADARKKSRAKTSARGAAPKRGAKAAAGPETEEAKHAEQDNIDRVRVEEADRRAIEDEQRELLKPKKYEQTEIEEYEAFAEDLERFFGELTVRQLASESAAPEQEVADDEQKSAAAEAEQAEAPKEDAEGSVEGTGEAPEVKPAAVVKYGKRILVPLSVEYDFKYLCDHAKLKVPEPLWPDPDKEPLPVPVIHQIVKKPANRAERQEVTMYSIWTPTPEPERPPTAEDGAAEESKEPVAEDGASEVEQSNEPKMDKTKTRWIIQPKESCTLYVKFFSEEVGEFPQTLNFEIVGSTRTFPLNLKANCAMPSINTNFKNVFFSSKRARPPQAPDSYLDKTYVVSEGVFDFGPLLIGKDAMKRTEDESLKAMNSAEIRITNNGQFDVDAAFALKSSLPSEEGGPGEQGPFILEPQTMELKKDQTKNLTIWSFPDQAKLFKDEIVCLLKNNPNPSIFSI